MPPQYTADEWAQWRKEQQCVGVNCGSQLGTVWESIVDPWDTTEAAVAEDAAVAESDGVHAAAPFEQVKSAEPTEPVQTAAPTQEVETAAPTQQAKQDAPPTQDVKMPAAVAEEGATDVQTSQSCDIDMVAAVAEPTRGHPHVLGTDHLFGTAQPAASTADAPATVLAPHGPNPSVVTMPPGLPEPLQPGASSSSNLAVLNAQYFKTYGPYVDSCKQHNAAAKWFREYCSRNDVTKVNFPSHSSVEVRDVIHEEKGAHFTFAQTKRRWHWHELIAQLNDESIDAVCGGQEVHACAFAIRNTKTPNKYQCWDFCITRGDGSIVLMHPEWNGLKLPAKIGDHNVIDARTPPPKSRPASMRYCDQTKSAWAATRRAMGNTTLRFEKNKNPRYIETQARRQGV